LCSCWFAWSRYGWTSIGRFVHVVLAFGLCGVLALNVDAGIAHATSHSQLTTAIARDVDRGMSIRKLAQAYSESIYPGVRDCEDRLRTIDHMRFPPFSNRPAEPEPVASDISDVFADLPMVPTGVRALRPIVVSKVDGERVVVVRPPGELRFELTPYLCSARGRFGMLPVSWAFGGRASVRFVVETITFTGEHHVLFERTLEPVSDERDRGFQTFSVSLPRDVLGFLVLSTCVVEGADTVSSWSYWNDVRVEGHPLDSEQK